VQVVSGSFDVDPQAMQAASAAFSAQSQALQSVHDSSSGFVWQGGRAYYNPEGEGYQTAVATLFKAMLPPMITKASDISTALSQSGSNYTDQDTTAAGDLTNSGAGS
jgi:hypothetical protein